MKKPRTKPPPLLDGGGFVLSQASPKPPIATTVSLLQIFNDRHPFAMNFFKPPLIVTATSSEAGSSATPAKPFSINTDEILSFADLITRLEWASASSDHAAPLINTPDRALLQSYPSATELTDRTTALLKASQGLAAINKKSDATVEPLKKTTAEPPFPLSKEDKAWLEAVKNQPNMTLTAPNPLLQPIQHFWQLEGNSISGTPEGEGFASAGLKHAYALSEKFQAQLAEGYKTGKPIRITVDDTLSIVFKIKGKQVSAEFLSTNGDAKALGQLSAQLEQLKAQMVQKQLPVGDLSFRPMTASSTEASAEEQGNQSHQKQQEHPSQNPHQNTPSKQQQQQGS